MKPTPHLSLVLATAAALVLAPSLAHAQRFFYVDSSVRIQVSPKEAEVYVDGFYAGRVDDFDGLFQRLRLEPGGHEITLYLDGYRVATQKVLLQPNATLKLRETLEPLKPGETMPARPIVPARQAPPERPRRS